MRSLAASGLDESIARSRLIRGRFVVTRGRRRSAAPETHRAIPARPAAHGGAASFETLRLTGFLRLAVLRRQQGRPTPMVLHGGLRHDRKNPPLPPHRVPPTPPPPERFGLTPY